MRGLLSALTITALATACNPSTETGDTGLNECDNSVVETFPVDGEANAYYRTSVDVTFDDQDESATVTVTGPDGEVSGSTSWRGDTLSFMPDAPLAPMSSYTTAITFECGEPSVSWSTGEVGGAITTDLLGKSYSLDLASGRFVEPEGVGAILQQYIGDQRILLGITALEGSDIQMIGAMGVEGSDPAVQEPCEPTIPFPTANFDSTPYFEVGPEDTTFNVSEYSITISDLFISGAFAPDGSYISGATLAGSVDTRPLVVLIGEDEEEDAICEIAGAIGVECQPCESDGQPFCLSVLVDSIQAAELPGYTLTEIDDPCLLEECAEDPDCFDQPQ